MLPLLCDCHSGSWQHHEALAPIAVLIPPLRLGLVRLRDGDWLAADELPVHHFPGLVGGVK
jgi:hypothetical protein